MRTRPIAGTAAGLLALAGLALAATPASAATSTARLSVLHAVPGLVVDVWVNGERTLDDFDPGELAGPLDLAAGTYTVAITASDAADADAPRSAPSTSRSLPAPATRPSRTSTPPAPRPPPCSPTTPRPPPPGRAG